MKAKSLQQKGKRFEKYVASEIEKCGLGKSIRIPGSGSGRIKGDVFSATDYIIECKNEKQWHWENIEQAKEEAIKGNYYKDKWILVIRNPRYPEFEEVEAVLPFSELLELLKKNQEPKIKEPDRETAWHIKNAINSLKQLLKDLEK